MFSASPRPDANFDDASSPIDTCEAEPHLFHRNRERMDLAGASTMPIGDQERRRLLWH